MSKRKTKAQREAEQREALHRRILDMANGAGGRDMSAEEEHFSPSDLSRLIPVLEHEFVVTSDDGAGGTYEKNSFLFRVYNLEHFETVDTLVEFLWDHGVRA